MGLFGTFSSKQIKKITPIVDKIEGLAGKYRDMSDSDLRGMTKVFKDELNSGKTLDDILPDAFATVREVATRTLGKRPFRVQLIGGIILHQGRISEMKTGEGKTLVATMPAYLNALEGKGVHIVTVNEYLAKRDSEEMGKIYEFLGLTTGLIYNGQSIEDKQAAYNCDITYGTNNEFGFDYLRDNMAMSKSQIAQRHLNYAIVDEVDSILIDEARTPLIISGPGAKSNDLYKKADALVRSLRPYVVKELDTKNDYDDIDEDYIVDEKDRRVNLSSNGIAKAERFFRIDNLSDVENNELMHYINEALQAHGIMKRDVDYVVADGQVLIVDTFTGRIMPGRRFSNGLHQAIEAKEKVAIQNENQTLATITFQNLFRMYDKLSGMTGTAMTEEDEFREIYGLDVVEIPTNKPMIRIDHPDFLYKNKSGKMKAIIEQIKTCNSKGQPVLVGTISVEKSEELSALLKKQGIAHNVLNAKYHEKEAEIIAQAGKYGAVTISTNMAGRGTDIMLGGNAVFLAKNELKKEHYSEADIALATSAKDDISPEIQKARDLYNEKLEYYKNEIAPEAQRVIEAGGLFILGTERHESRRIDNQLRGRSGRQGDPGESRFFLSLEDDLLRLFGSERVMGIVETMKLPEDEPIEQKIISNAVESAQKKLEGNNFSRRKNVLEYDDVMSQQRELIYKQRRQVLDGEDMTKTIDEMVYGSIESALAYCTDGNRLDIGETRARLFWILGKEDVLDDTTKPKDLKAKLEERVKTVYESQKQFYGTDFGTFSRAMLLHAVDRAWMDHLDEMDDLRDSVGFSHNPLQEYRLQSTNLFDDMIEKIREDTTRFVLFMRPKDEQKSAKEAEDRLKAAKNVGSEKEKLKPLIKKDAEKIGRNDPCPCGSGLKYKKCHGRDK